MLIPFLLLVILGVDWATGYAIAGFVMRHGVTPYGYALWQSFGPFLLLFIIQLLRRDLSIDRKGLVYAVLCGLIGLALPNLLIYFASRYVTSGLLTILANTAPIMIYPLALIFSQEQFNYKRLILVLLGSIGILLLIWPLETRLHALFPQTNYWLYLALLIPLCYAFAAVYISRFRPFTGNVLSYAMWMLFVSSLFIVPLALAKHEFYPLRLTDYNSWLIILEIILSMVGYVLLFIIIKMVGPVYYSLVNAIAAATGLFYGLVIFGQSFSGRMYLALGLILIAIIGLTFLQQFSAKHTQREQS